MQNMQTAKKVNLLLKSFAGGEVVGLDLISANAVSRLVTLVKSGSEQEEYKRLLTHMRRLQLVDIEKLADGKTYISLTTKGKKRAEQASLDEVLIEKPKSWDSKWRIVTYDIPGTKRHERYEFINQLNRLGFDRLLQSMWVYPFACAEQIQQLSKQLGLERSIVYLEADLDISHHKQMLKHFARELKNLSNK